MKYEVTVQMEAENDGDILNALASVGTVRQATLNGRPINNLGDYPGAPKEYAADPPDEFPKATGGGWYVLSNGDKVQGKDDAIAAEAVLHA